MSFRWEAIQEQKTWRPDVEALSAVNFKHDTRMSLPQLDEFAHAAQHRQSNVHDAGFTPRSNLTEYSARQLPKMFGDCGVAGMALANLHGFETWMGISLSDWVDLHQREGDACGQLLKLMKQYHSVATGHYAGNPDFMSVMILVSMELWVACDKIATSACSLLEEYCPGVSRAPLQNLLLPFKDRMDRLHCVEEYLARRSRSLHQSSELVRATDSPNGFAARYFDQSPDHQALRTDISKRATAARTSELEELNQLQTRHNTLMTQHREKICNGPVQHVIETMAIV